MFDYWEDVWIGLLALLIVCGLGFWAFAASQDHAVRWYYLSDSGGKTFCIDADRNWWPDDQAVYCSDDIQKALDALKRANEARLVVLHAAR